MWIFSKTGFVSAVEHRDDPSLIMLRARARKDLGPFLKVPGTKVNITPDADYKYRVILPKDAFSKILSSMASDIDYPNFKNAVHGDPGRDNAYMHVWSAMRAFQK